MKSEDYTQCYERYCIASGMMFNRAGELVSDYLAENLARVFSLI